MKGIKSPNAYWDFANMVRTERRFIFDGKSGKFLTAVRAASKSRARSLEPGSFLYRAQIGSTFAPENEFGVEEEHPHPPDRMIPNTKATRSGRANPPGFPYLYLATNENTALAEMRPWVGESLTLAVFKIRKKIKLVVCQIEPEDVIARMLNKKHSAEQISNYVWNDISKAFARPVNQEDRENAYLPTQVLAEAFKAEGFDGLAYQSGLERGANIVLFDVNVAELFHRYVYTLKKVQYSFEAVPNHGIYRKDKKGVRQHLATIKTESP